jgi:signal transduction histidine kinase
VFLGSQVSFLEEFQEVIPVEEMRHPALRKSAHEIVSLCRRTAPGHLPKESVRDVLRLAEQLERNACLYDALTTRAAVIQMDASLRTLRDFITADLRSPDERERLAVERLVKEAVAQLAEFAAASHVEVRVQTEEGGLEVEGEHRELSRAIANLLHNAIKYSWHRDRSTTPWVAVRLGRDGRRVHVEFETWGVPITREELEEGMVFRIGYRGKFSTDRGRLGTGIGLTDALRVASQHGGTLTIESEPSRASGIAPDDPAYYRQPFLTRTRLLLPAARP